VVPRPAHLHTRNGRARHRPGSRAPCPARPGAGRPAPFRPRVPAPRLADLAGRSDRTGPGGFVERLGEAYPARFARPRLAARLAVDEALRQLVRLLRFPPGAPDSGGHDPWGHLLALLAAGDR
jgi:hypothetical protein